jgi:predicted 2-oxoglutarate/Fe(II)-dependent dioxygenase YbiX
MIEPDLANIWEILDKMPFKPPPASEQGPLTFGERLCDLPFLDNRGRPLSLYDNRIFGWPKLVHLAATAESAAPGMQRLAGQMRALMEAETQAFCITRSPAEANAAVAERIDSRMPLLADEAGRLHAAAGLDPDAPPRTLIFDSLLRFEHLIAEGDGASQIDAALEYARARFERHRPMVTAAQAPVLMVPNLLDPDHCRRLIEFWDRNDKMEYTATSKPVKGRDKPKGKSRSDVHILLGTPECDELLAVLCRRLLPEVSKAFNFEITRVEHFRVGCYDSARGGYFVPHRDNTSEITAHRRYALTLNLNTGDYEGGFLRLPEYGSQLYAPPAGGGAVFSCSLLHMATPVTKDRRFALITFFWGEGEQKTFERSHADMVPQGWDFNLIA